MLQRSQTAPISIFTSLDMLHSERCQEICDLLTPELYRVDSLQFLLPYEANDDDDNDDEGDWAIDKRQTDRITGEHTLVPRFKVSGRSKPTGPHHVT